jgi:hypothetical protein
VGYTLPPLDTGGNAADDQEIPLCRLLVSRLF